MFEIQYRKTGTKDKPSYDALFICGTEALKLATLEHTEVDTKMGRIAGWQASGVLDAKSRRLRDLQRQVEGLVFNLAVTHFKLAPFEAPAPVAQARKGKGKGSASPASAREAESASATKASATGSASEPGAEPDPNVSQTSIPGSEPDGGSPR